MSAVVPFVTLTDVELTVLEQAHLRALDGGGAPAGHTSGPDGEVRRSLRARGLLTADGGLATGSSTADEPPDLAGAVGLALDVRLAADVVVVAQRLVGRLVDGQRQSDAPSAVGSARVLHLTGAGACVEDLDEEGLVSLSLTTDPARAAGSLPDALLPPDAVDGTGEPVQVVPGALGRLPEVLGRPTVLAELTVLLPAEPAPGQDEDGRHPDGAPAATRVMLALGPGGCWAGQAGQAGQAGPGEDAQFTLHPVQRTWLAERAALTVEAVMGPPRPAPEDGTMGR